MIFASIQHRGESCTSLSHPVVTALALHLTNTVAKQSQLHTGKCPFNFPHREKMRQCMRMLCTIGSSPSYWHCGFLCSSQTCKPNSRMPFLSGSRSLLVSLNYSRCAFMLAAGNTLPLMNISLIYKEVALLTISSCLTMALMMNHMIWGATFSPNPKQVWQYLCPLISTVWNCH